jgi:hypothetical protein
MKLRHATALALVGWYLMLPPKSGWPVSYDTAAPLPTWAREGHYLSLTECTKRKTEILKEVCQTPPAFDRDVWSESCAAARTALRCVSTNDPRLKPK